MAKPDIFLWGDAEDKWLKWGGSRNDATRVERHDCFVRTVEYRRNFGGKNTSLIAGNGSFQSLWPCDF